MGVEPVTVKGIIFDLDGVLVDTVPLHFAAWQRMFGKFGFHFDYRDYHEKVDGKPRQDGVRGVMHSASEATIEAAGLTKQAYYLEMIEQDQLQPFPTSIPLIKELRQQGVLLAAASSSVNTRFILDKIGVLDDFAAIVTAADVERGKPDPEIFLAAAQKLNLDVDHCVVFEDALSGVTAAKRGGFVCIGVDRHGHAEYFRGADAVVADLGDLDYTGIGEIHGRALSAARVLSKVPA